MPESKEYQCDYMELSILPCLNDIAIRFRWNILAAFGNTQYLEHFLKVINVWDDEERSSWKVLKRLEKND